MKCSIIIPAHNEANVIGLTLQSLVEQSLKPKEIIVVNDNSTDKTADIVTQLAEKYNCIKLINNKSNDQHLPGSKIINAFYKGYEVLDKDFDIICKFDADLIFPKNYIETIVNSFNEDSTIGMTAGFCDIKVNGKWQLENLTNKDHIRGALKAYTKNCFNKIGQLKPSMGWDTVDELLAEYYGFKIINIDSLRVKHLKPTGASYNKKSKYLQGEAMYKIRYGFILTVISALKLALKKQSLSYFTNYIIGYLKASFKQSDYLVSSDEGKFIRRKRWLGIKDKVS